MTQDEFHAYGMIGACGAGLALYGLGRTVFKPRNPSTRKNSAAPGERWSNNTPLIDLAPGEPWPIADSFENTLIIGGPGSGKTSTSSAAICKAFLRNGYGGLVLTVKPDEAARWVTLCEETGRSSDLRIIDDTGKYSYNFLESFTAAGGPGVTENLVYFFEDVGHLVDKQSGQGGGKQEESFWQLGTRSFMRNVFDLIRIPMGKITVPYIMDVIREASASSESFANPQWRADSAIFKALRIGKAIAKSEADEHDYQYVENYWDSIWPATPEKTRGVFVSKFLGTIEPLSRGLLYTLFSTGTSFRPQEIIEDSVVAVINIPVKTKHETGLIGQTILKTTVQQALENREPSNKRPVFIFIDEAQHFLTKRDMHFAATSRSARCANIWATQSIAEVYVSTGGDETGKATADSLLALCNTKIAHANSDPISNQWMADLIGRRRRRMPNFNASPQTPGPTPLDPSRPNVSAGMSTVYEYAVFPHEFARLKKPNEDNPVAEAIVVNAGRTFSQTKDIFCRATFSRED